MLLTDRLKSIIHKHNYIMQNIDTKKQEIVQTGILHRLRPRTTLEETLSR
jgi:hypothetical protein